LDLFGGDGVILDNERGKRWQFLARYL